MVKHRLKSIAGISQIIVLLFLSVLVFLLPILVKVTEKTQVLKKRAEAGCDNSFRSFSETVVPGEGSSTKRLKQTLLDQSGKNLVWRYGYWGGQDYTNWDNWTSVYGNLDQYGPDGKLTYNSFSEVAIPEGTLAYGRLKQTLLQSDGKTLWWRYGHWTGQDYTTWDSWTNQWGNLDEYGPRKDNPNAPSTFLSFNEIVLPYGNLAYGRIKQTLLASDGKTIWWRYGYWDKNLNDYTGWTRWDTAFGDLNAYGPNANLSFRSFSEAILPTANLSYGRVKQNALTSDGKTIWWRYGYWDGSQQNYDYKMWTPWSTQYGQLDQYGPPGSLTYLSFNEDVQPYNNVAYGRIKQNLLQDNGVSLWWRYGYWDEGKQDYTSWTSWSMQYGDLKKYGPSFNLDYRSFSEAVIPSASSSYGRLKQSLLINKTLGQLTPDSNKAIWWRYGYWGGQDYTNWDNWTSVYGNLDQYGPDGKLTYNSFSEVAIPEGTLAYGRLKQTLLQSDGKTLWWRYGHWTGQDYTTWDSWTNQWGDLSVFGPASNKAGAPTVFRSFSETTIPFFGLSYGRLKQSLLASDGKTIWWRYGYWDKGGTDYGNWTSWTTQYGDLRTVGCVTPTPTQIPPTPTIKLSPTPTVTQIPTPTSIPGCGSDNDCSSGLVCDVSTRKCVECLNDNNCSATKRCLNKTCVAPVCSYPSDDPVERICKQEIFENHQCKVVAVSDGTACLLNGKNGQCQNGSCILPPQSPLINFKIKFDGVNRKISDQKVKVKIVGLAVEKTFSGINVTADDQGVLSGTFEAVGIQPGENYTFIIKGPKHLGTKFCADKQTGVCTGRGKLTIVAGQNNFDFSGFKLLAGDIPDENGNQDGVVDSSDFSLLIQSLEAETAEAVKSRADLNFDGGNTGVDIQLFLATMSKKYDDDAF